MQSIIEKVLWLKQVELFQRLPGEDLAQLAEVVRQVRFQAGEIILDQGEVSDRLYCVVEGEASVRAGNQEIAKVHGGETIGELGLFDQVPRNNTVVALSEVVTFELQEDIFFALLEDRPEIARGIIAVMARRLRRLNEKLLGFEAEKNLLAE